MQPATLTDSEFVGHIHNEASGGEDGSVIGPLGSQSLTHSLNVKGCQYSKLEARCKPYELEQLVVLLAKNLKLWSCRGTR